MAGITTDRINTVRSNPPTIGALETGFDFLGPEITFTNIENTFLLTNRALPNFATITDFNGVDTADNKPRIYFKKSTDANAFGFYPGDNNSSFNGWKYVEANNTASPFSFTLDYSLLTGSESL